MFSLVFLCSLLRIPGPRQRPTGCRGPQAITAEEPPRALVWTASVLAAAKNKRVQACIALDPWFLPRDYDKIDCTHLSTIPVQALTTETYDASKAKLHDHRKSREEFLERIKDNPRVDVAYMLDCGHCNQIDKAVLIPIEARLKAPHMFGPFGSSLLTNEIKLK